MRWKQTSPRMLSSPGGATTLLSGICAGLPVPAACQRSIRTNDHQMRTHSWSSESASDANSMGVYLHNFIVFANATARDSKNGSEADALQSASIMSNKRVCACTIFAAWLRGASLVSQSLSRALASLTSPDDGWTAANKAVENAVRIGAGACIKRDCKRALLCGRMGYTG